MLRLPTAIDSLSDYVAFHILKSVHIHCVDRNSYFISFPISLHIFSFPVKVQLLIKIRYGYTRVSEGLAPIDAQVLMMLHRLPGSLSRKSASTRHNIGSTCPERPHNRTR